MTALRFLAVVFGAGLYVAGPIVYAFAKGYAVAKDWWQG